jgi:hypothetical protein
MADNEKQLNIWLPEELHVQKKTITNDGETKKQRPGGETQDQEG